MTKLSDEIKQELLIILVCLLAGFALSKAILYYAPKPINKNCQPKDSIHCVQKLNDTKS